MARTERLFQLMQLLRQCEPPVRAESLAHDVAVSVRTIYRDIETLRSLGAVIDGEAGFGYRLIEDASLPPFSFDDEEIEALVLGLREVVVRGDVGLAEASKRALSKLKARLPPSQSHRLEHAVLSATRFAPMPEPGIDVRVLRRAAWDEMRVRFAYRDGQGRDTEREVDPLGITAMDNAHCLLGFCHLRDDFRAFRLDRMSNLTVLTQSFRPKRVPMLRAYVSILRANRDASAIPRKEQN